MVLVCPSSKLALFESVVVAEKYGKCPSVVVPETVIGNANDPEPQAAVVPETMPEELTCKHCVDPVTPLRVSALRDALPVNSPAPFRLATIVPDPQPVSDPVAPAHALKK